MCSLMPLCPWELSSFISHMADSVNTPILSAPSYMEVHASSPYPLYVCHIDKDFPDDWKLIHHHALNFHLGGGGGGGGAPEIRISLK